MLITKNKKNNLLFVEKLINGKNREKIVKELVNTAVNQYERFYVYNASEYI